MNQLLADALANSMRQSGKSIAVSESITSGLLQNYLAMPSGSSTYYRGGITCYALQSKIAILRIDPKLVFENEAVTSKVAMEMATSVCRLFEADIGIGTTGFAQPPSGEERPYAFYAIAHNGGIAKVEHVYGDGLSRNEMRMRVAEAAIGDLIGLLAAQTG